MIRDHGIGGKREKEMKKVVLAIAIVFSAGITYAGVITVANPSFEAQTLADGYNNSAATATDDGSAISAGGDGSITGWTKSSSSDWLCYVINPAVGFNQATDGNNAVFMQNITLAQGLTGLTILDGDTITVTFDLWLTNSGNPNNFEVNFAGLGAQNPSAAPTVGGPVVPQEITFTATSDITAGDLTFRSTAGGKRYRLDNVVVTVIPNLLPSISFFTATPSTVDPGETVTLSWSTTKADSLSIDQGIGEVTGSTSSTQVVVNALTTYILSAVNSHGTTTASATVVLNSSSAPTIHSFTATPNLLPLSGGTVTLSWNVSDASTLSISPSIGDEAALTVNGEGSIQLAVGTKTTYTLTASNPVGAVAAEVAASSLKVPESDFSRGLTWGGVACSESDYTLWGASPIVSADGKVHLFVARWPGVSVDPPWTYASEVAHYVADHPEGPFIFSDVALQGTGVDGDWDKRAPCNPEIQFFEGLYVLLYIGNTGSVGFPANQRTGMATAPTPYGPWTKVGDTGQIIFWPEDMTEYPRFTQGERIVNPTLLKVGDTYHIYFKTKEGSGNIYGVATSTNLTGPYTLQKDPVTPSGIVIEDACSFIQNGIVHLLTTDNFGHVTGITGGGALWSSTNGLLFTDGNAALGFEKIPAYYKEYDPTKVTKRYGSAAKLERPKVLMIGGRPRYLYGPSGWNVTGGDRPVVHVLRVEDPPTEITQINILQNGDFEAGTGISDSDWGDTPDATKLPGWSWGSDVRIVLNDGSGTLGFGDGSGNLVSPTSDQQVGFASTTGGTPDPGDSALWQTFDTVPGTAYEVVFSMGASGPAGTGLSVTVSVHAGADSSGTLLGTLESSRTSGPGYSAPTALVFTATSSQSTLLLVETSANSNLRNLAIDQIFVGEATPPLEIGEPSTTPVGEFGFNWHLAHGRGVDIYRTENLTDPFDLIAEDEWMGDFTDTNSPALPKAFYKAVLTGETS